MTLEAQRIAIAEACGMTYEHDGNTHFQWRTYIHPTTFEVFKSSNSHYLRAESIERFLCQQIPNYLSDLNAMHEAEKVLSGEQWKTYIAHIAYKTNWQQCCIICTHATAAQRAEAFLRTIGKWDDTK